MEYHKLSSKEINKIEKNCKLWSNLPKEYWQYETILLLMKIANIAEITAKDFRNSFTNMDERFDFIPDDKNIVYNYDKLEQENKQLYKKHCH